ncbi:hypothetical protein ACC699_17015 [Rhizobium ruizarguesonis]|uniref:hypothetical protein n=1 Tax=Rhizobium ruizarguesonis TaxID=2081791 RepID=UPI0013BE35AA|nr:hypothetical protein [Rhizobium ruizarguesonis]NEI07856.1 hypothetical protein [Rhizobium ruizarguesonis]NEJ10452.1 hypothetical protein [Rhizobium ruizarguesonis]
MNLSKSLVLLAGLVVAGSSQAETSCRASKAAYDALYTGMSYGHAVATIGCEGEELSSSEFSGIKTVMYMWNGAGIGNMNAMFQRDGLVSKAQFGLK